MVFTGKEKDSDLSGLFLSVDPMADKYPSLSPYAYCAWNPVRLVDPKGKEVYISGDDAEQATKQLSSRGLTITRDENTGKLSYIKTGKKLSQREKALISAIDSKSVRVDVNATTQSSVPLDDNYSLDNSMYCGQFLGVTLPAECNNKGLRETAETKQLVNPLICEERDKHCNVPIGTSLVHEITESYQAGLLCLNPSRQYSVGPSWRSSSESNHVYFKAHSLATPQASDYRERNNRAITKMFNTIYGERKGRYYQDQFFKLISR